MFSAEEEDLSAEWQAVEAQLGFRPRFGDGEEDIKNVPKRFLEPSEPDSILHEAAPTISEHNLGGDVRIKVYQPPVAKVGGFPLGVFMHSGSVLIGGLDSEDSLCRALASTAPCIIVSVAYRLAPEAKVPTQLQDSCRAFQWAWENRSKLGGDHNRIFCAGTSVGGALAFGLALAVVEEGHGDELAGVVAVNPVTCHPEQVPPEHGADYRSYREHGQGRPVMSIDGLRSILEASGSWDQPSNPFIWPLLHPKKRELRRCCIIVTGLDPLRDDGVVMAKALEWSGVRTKFKKYNGLPHCFWVFPQMREAIRQLKADLAEGVRFVFKEPSDASSSSEEKIVVDMEAEAAGTNH